MLAGKPFYFVGTNAYYLLEQASRNDTQTVQSLFRTANNLGMTVVRTWGFFDSPDSANPAVIQYQPGVFNEHALRALDYVIYQAKLHGVRLLVSFVNSWDDYGGMNQYVRWRSGLTPGDAQPGAKYSPFDLHQTIEGGSGRSYRYAIDANFGHDDFYSDATIRNWFRNYIFTILNRVNTITGVRYMEEPFIFGWELANEPRSSERSGTLVHNWVQEMADYVKSVDQNHLVGTGEEGFDVSAAAYSVHSYNNQRWLFDGSSGVSFGRNSVIQPIDFASCHLYPESWNLSNNAGNVWMRDHIRVARATGKPLVVGEFGVRVQKVPTYESWLTTALLDGAAGAMVWQILEGPRTDGEGFGFRCPQEELLCSRLHDAAAKFRQKSQSGMLTVPAGFALHQNYPNPFNGVTTISYAIPFDALVELSVYDILGQRVATVVNEMQGAGERKELLESKSLASGPYVYTLSIRNQPGNRLYTETKRLILLR